MEYKYSKYNIIITIPGSEKAVLVNTYSGAMILIDNEVKQILKNNDVSSLPENIRKEFINNYILIPSDLNELDKISFEYNFARLRPKKFRTTVTLTRDCNLACPYCYQLQRKVKNKVYLTKENAETLIRFYKTTYKEYQLPIWIFLNGGEPLLNFELAQYIFSKLNDESIPWILDGIVTNGTLLTVEKLKYINNKGKNQEKKVRIQITLDGPKDIHNKYRFYKFTGNGTYDTIIKNLKKCVKFEHIIPLVRINISHENSRKEHIIRLLTELKREGLNNRIYLYFAPVTSIHHPVIKNCRDKYFITGEELSQVYNLIFKLSEEVGINIGYGSPFARSPYSCMFDNPFDIGIDVDLKVYNCWEFIGVKKYSIGEIDKNGNLKLNPFAYTAYSRNPVSFENCKNCKLLPICMGGCAKESLKLHGSLFNSGCPASKMVYKVVFSHMARKLLKIKHKNNKKDLINHQEGEYCE